MHSCLFFVTAKGSGLEDNGVEESPKEAADRAQCYRGDKHENVYRHHLHVYRAENARMRQRSLEQRILNQ
jgi:hypothetical protein